MGDEIFTDKMFRKPNFRRLFYVTMLGRLLSARFATARARTAKTGVKH